MIILTMFSGGAISPPAIPAAPVLSYSALAETSLTLTATIVAGATNYKFYQDGVLKATQPSNVYPVTGLTGSTAYAFKVKASNVAGDSVDSNVVSVTTAASALVTPTLMYTGIGGWTSPSSGVFSCTTTSSGNVFNGKLIGDGYVEMLGNPTGDDQYFYIGLDTDNTREWIEDGSGLAWKCGVNFTGGTVRRISTMASYAGIYTDPTHTNYRIVRVGTTVSIWTSLDGVTYVNAYDFPDTFSGQMFIKIGSAWFDGVITSGVIKVYNAP